MAYYNSETNLYSRKNNIHDQKCLIKSQNINIDKAPDMVLKMLLYNMFLENQKLKEKLEDCQIRLELTEEIPERKNCYNYTCDKCGLVTNCYYEYVDEIGYWNHCEHVECDVFYCFQCTREKEHPKCKHK